MIVTRFAPSPTGLLHLGHAYSAFFAYRQAQQLNGRFLLRIEDIDPVRCKPEYVEGIFQDLHWMGLGWEEPVRRQSEHIEDYVAALDLLIDRNLVYPCFCTRKEIASEAAASGYAPHVKENVIYSGICRHLSPTERTLKLQKQGAASWRLDVMKALSITGSLYWHDRIKGRIEARPQDFGDVVLARKDVATSYHLSVTVDDHLQGITLVTRGEDLLRSTDIHRLIQALMGYEVPEYHHHHLQTDASGRRYAKRDKSVTLRSLQAEGKTLADIQAMAGFPI